MIEALRGIALALLFIGMVTVLFGAFLANLHARRFFHAAFALGCLLAFFLGIANTWVDRLHFVVVKG